MLGFEELQKWKLIPHVNDLVQIYSNILLLSTKHDAQHDKLSRLFEL